MDNSTNSALMSTTAAQFGAFLGGFVITMLFTSILLRIAGSPTRGPSAAAVLRTLAVLLALFLAYAGYLGSGGQINLGGVLAVIVTVAWAFKQTRKPA
jgi:hypothetical protein